SSKSNLQFLHSCPTRRSSDLQEGRVPVRRVAPRDAVELVRTVRPGDVVHGSLVAVPGAAAAPAQHAGSAGAVERRQLAGTLGRRSEEHTSELQSREKLVCRLL